MIYLAKYRSYYKEPKQKPSFSNSNNLSLNSELQSLQNELQELRNRTIPRRQQSINIPELETFFMNKFILIGGCIAIGLGIGYLLFSNRRRCK